MWVAWRVYENIFQPENSLFRDIQINCLVLSAEGLPKIRDVLVTPEL